MSLSSTLSLNQKKIIGTALSFIAIFTIAALTVLGIKAIATVLSFFSVVAWPLIIAGILALLLKPCIHFFEKRLKINETGSILLLYTLVLLGLFALSYKLLPIIANQVVLLGKNLPQIGSNLEQSLGETFPTLMQFIHEKISQEAVATYSSEIIKSAKSLASFSLPALQEAGMSVLSFLGSIATLGVIPVYLFYMLRAKRNPLDFLDNNLRFLKAKTRKTLRHLTEEFISILIAFFRGQILIGFIMGIFYSLGFALSGLQFSLILGLMLGFLNIIPYLGTIIGLLIVLPIAYFQPEGGWITLGLCLGTFGIVQLAEGYFLTPQIMGEKTGMHPMTIIVAIFFWGTAFNGILGMVLGIPLTAFMIVAWRFILEKYLAAQA